MNLLDISYGIGSGESACTQTSLVYRIFSFGM